MMLNVEAGVQLMLFQKYPCLADWHIAQEGRMLLLFPAFGIPLGAEIYNILYSLT